MKLASTFARAQDVRVFVADLQFVVDLHLLHDCNPPGEALIQMLHRSVRVPVQISYIRYGLLARELMES